jgi:hypothetical protein
VFTKNRDRLLEAEVAQDFLALVAWASAKSFQSKNKKSWPPPEDLTVLALDYTQISGGAAYFMAPGLYMAASFGNDYFFPSTWRVAVLNFIFYFGLGYVCTMVWQKQISKAK